MTSKFDLPFNGMQDGKSWRLANSLIELYNQVNRAFPERDTTIGPDGDIGDAAHRARTSDHNPDENGVVAALDLSHDPAHGFDSYGFAESLRANRDERIKYVISNRRIFYGPRSPSHGGNAASQWLWNAYHGENPHDQHVHISVGDPRFYDHASAWTFDPHEAPPSVEANSGKGSWYSQYHGKYTWHDPGDAPGSNALGVPDNRQGCAFYSRATLGHWFAVSAPNSRTLLLPQTDIGPQPRTARRIDISARAAEAFGYSPDNFPTDGIFSWDNAAPPLGTENLTAKEQAIAYDPIQVVSVAPIPAAATVSITTSGNVRISINGKDVTTPATPAGEATMPTMLTALTKNWKTSAAGGLLILYALASLAGISVPGMPALDTNAAIAAIIAGLQGLVAKDHNVTGGTVRQ